MKRNLAVLIFSAANCLISGVAAAESPPTKVSSDPAPIGATATPASSVAPNADPDAAPPPPAPTAPVAAPPPQDALPPARAEDGEEAPAEHQTKKGLMIAGFSTLGGSYLFTALVGLTMLSGVTTQPGQVCTNCQSVGGKLLIPILGPWIALPEADGADGKAISAALGIAQGVGVVLTVVGISVYVHSKSDASARISSFGVVPTPGGAEGAVVGVF
jgi:hypothetical protein